VAEWCQYAVHVKKGITTTKDVIAAMSPPNQAAYLGDVNASMNTWDCLMLIIELLGAFACLLLAAYLLGRPRQKDTRLADAEAYIRDQHPLYRHYNIKAVQDTLRDKRAGRTECLPAG